MSRKLKEPQTPLAVAAAELAIARDAVASIEAANRGNEEKFGRVLETFDNAVSTVGAGSPAARKAAAGIAAMRDGIARGRVPLDAAKRRVAQAAEKLASENRAISVVKENLRRQSERVRRAEEMIAVAEKVVGAKREALAREETMRAHFRGELNTLIGGAEPSEEGI